MGKRKSRQVQQKGPPPKVDTVFDCPYCCNKATVEVQIQKKDGIGRLWCRVCSVSYQKRLGPLDKQVDIFCAWIDEADEANRKRENDLAVQQQRNVMEPMGASNTSSIPSKTGKYNFNPSDKHSCLLLSNSVLHINRQHTQSQVSLFLSNSYHI